MDEEVSIIRRNIEILDIEVSINRRILEMQAGGRRAGGRQEGVRGNMDGRAHGAGWPAEAARLKPPVICRELTYENMYAGALC